MARGPLEPIDPVTRESLQGAVAVRGLLVMRVLKW